MTKEMICLIKGKALKKGDTIGIINISSYVKDDTKVNTVVSNLENMGFNVKAGQTCYERYGYLAGTDEMRVHDLNMMFSDSKVDAIICLRGGFGSIRILDKIDYEMIKKNPKIFIGYSDVTAAHIAIGQKTGLVTFHGPMLIGEFENGLHELTYKYAFLVLTGKDYVEYQNPLDNEIKCLVKGEVHAPIIGGNLSVMVSTLGTEFEIDTTGKILFIEEIGEEMYRIDTMLSQLRLAKKLDKCVGIILGQFTNCKENEEEFSLNELLNQFFVPLNKPTIMNFQAGHTTPNFSIALGAEAYLNATEKKLVIESALI